MRAYVVSILLITACGGGRAAPLPPSPPGSAAGTPIAPPPAGPTAAPVAAAAAAAAAPNVTLVLEGTPEIPPALRARLEPYLNTRSASVADLSDDGKVMLISTRFGETAQLHRLAMPGGARTQLTFGTEPVRSGVFAPANSRALVYGRDVGGDEQYQLYRLDLDGARTTLLTDGKSRNVGALWSDDGRKLAWGSTSRNGRDVDIWVSGGARAEGAQLVVEGKGSWSPIAFSRDGKRLLILEYVGATRTMLHLADLDKKSVAAVTVADPPAAYRDAVLAPDGKRAYVTSDRAGEFLELYEVDLAKGAWRSLTSSIPWNVDEIELSRDGRHLAFVTNEGGYGRLHLLDTRTRKAARVAGVPEGLVGGLVFARKAPVLGFTLSSATRNGDAYTYDVRKKKVTRWTESELGGLDAARLREPTLVEYKTFDGAKIPAFYYRPAGAGPFPVVVSIHGGPEGQARPSFSATVQLLLEDGFAVITPNVRGSTGYGKTYLDLDNGFKREDSVKDIGALLDWIAQQKELDAKRVAVTGGSYGGYMVLASLVRFGDRIRAGTDSVGISNFITFLENTAEYRRDLRRVEYGDERDPKMREFLTSISPLNQVDKIKSALLVAQGANDPRVPVGEADQIVRAVRTAGKDVWYVLARDEGHGFGKKENRDTLTLLELLFLQKHLAR